MSLPSKKETKPRISWLQAFRLLKRVALKKYRIKYYSDSGYQANVSNVDNIEPIDKLDNGFITVALPKKRTVVTSINKDELSKADLIKHEIVELNDEKLAQILITNIVEEIKYRVSSSSSRGSIDTLYTPRTQPRNTPFDSASSTQELRFDFISTKINLTHKNETDKIKSNASGSLPHKTFKSKDDTLVTITGYKTLNKPLSLQTKEEKEEEPIRLKTKEIKVQTHETKEPEIKHIVEIKEQKDKNNSKGVKTEKSIQDKTLIKKDFEIIPVKVQKEISTKEKLEEEVANKVKVIAKEEIDKSKVKNEKAKENDNTSKKEPEIRKVFEIPIEKVDIRKSKNLEDTNRLKDDNSKIKPSNIEKSEKKESFNLRESKMIDKNESDNQPKDVTVKKEAEKEVIDEDKMKKVNFNEYLKKNQNEKDSLVVEEHNKFSNDKNDSKTKSETSKALDKKENNKPIPMKVKPKDVTVKKEAEKEVIDEDKMKKVNFNEYLKKNQNEKDSLVVEEHNKFSNDKNDSKTKSETSKALDKKENNKPIPMKVKPKDVTIKKEVKNEDTDEDKMKKVNFNEYLKKNQNEKDSLKKTIIKTTPLVDESKLDKRKPENNFHKQQNSQEKLSQQKFITKSDNDNIKTQVKSDENKLVPIIKKSSEPQIKFKKIKKEKVELPKKIKFEDENKKIGKNVPPQLATPDGEKPLNNSFIGEIDNDMYETNTTFVETVSGTSIHDSDEYQDFEENKNEFYQENQTDNSEKIDENKDNKLSINLPNFIAEEAEIEEVDKDNNRCLFEFQEQGKNIEDDQNDDKAIIQEDSLNNIETEDEKNSKISSDEEAEKFDQALNEDVLSEDNLQSTKIEESNVQEGIQENLYNILNESLGKISEEDSLELNEENPIVPVIRVEIINNNIDQETQDISNRDNDDESNMSQLASTESEKTIEFDDYIDNEDSEQEELELVNDFENIKQIKDKQDIENLKKSMGLITSVDRRIRIKPRSEYEDEDSTNNSNVFSFDIGNRFKTFHSKIKGPSLSGRRDSTSPLLFSIANQLRVDGTDDFLSYKDLGPETPPLERTGPIPPVESKINRMLYCSTLIK